MKSVQFKDHKYVGDPRIAVKIFNDKGCDELVLLDITATNEGRRPNFQLIEEIASEAFMPVAYGGGVLVLSEPRLAFGPCQQQSLQRSNFAKKLSWLYSDMTEQGLH